MTTRRPAEPTAVIGMAVRLPDADTVERFWDNGEAGVVSTRRFTPDELVAAGVPESDAHDPEYVGAGALLDDIAGFDAACFGMSPRDAAITDPQLRLFLEVCQDALDDSGYAAPDATIGVFGTTGYHLHPLGGYLRSNLDGRVFDEGMADNHVSKLRIAFANHPDFAATTAAFRLGLSGPAMSVQAGCSSGMVLVSLAARALRDGDCDVAVVAGSALHVPQITGYRHVPGSILSRTGRCRAFDARSDGTVAGNGAVAVVLKRLDHAERDGDRVAAVIRAVGVNNDGADKQAYAAPSVSGQVAVLARTLADADVTPDEVGYIETHGTGTFKGDPIEFEALTTVYAAATGRGRCALGSAKPNIGHLDSAAGLAGLVRAIGAVSRGVIPPLAGFTAPHPRLALDDGPFFLPRRGQPWPTTGRRVAGVSALGVGGTNAHVIITEPPPSERAATDPEADGEFALPLSAADPTALRRLARDWIEFLYTNPAARLADVVTTACLGRRHREHRLVVFGRDTDALRQALAFFVSDIETPTWATASDRVADATPSRGTAGRYLDGADVDWSAVLPRRGRRVRVPGYPYQRKTHWIGPAARPDVSPGVGRSASRGDNSMTTVDSILEHVRQATATALGHDSIDADSPFTSLGADSLSMVNLAQGLQRRYGVRISLRRLFEEADTPARLAAVIAADLPDTATEADTASSGAAGESRPVDAARSDGASSTEAAPAATVPDSPTDAAAPVPPDRPAAGTDVPHSAPPRAAGHPAPYAPATGPVPNGGWFPPPFAPPGYPPYQPFPAYAPQPGHHGDPAAAVTAAAQAVERLADQLGHLATAQAELTAQLSRLLAAQDASRGGRA